MVTGGGLFYILLFVHVSAALLVICAVFARFLMSLVPRICETPLLASFFQSVSRSVTWGLFVGMALLIMTGTYWVMSSGMGFQLRWVQAAYAMSCLVILFSLVERRWRSILPQWARFFLQGGVVVFVMMILRDAITQSTWFFG